MLKSHFFWRDCAFNFNRASPSSRFSNKLTEVSNGHQKVTELSGMLLHKPPPGMLLHKPPPGMLSEVASFDEVRRWIKDDYLTFYRHNSMLNHLDVTIDLVNSFEKWLIRKYTSLLVSGEGMAYRQIHTLKKRMVYPCGKCSL